MTQCPDPLTGISAPNARWTTTNLAEAMPGVLTPLGWTAFGPSVELGTRRAFRLVGALRRDEARLPVDERERFINVFYGRAAARVDFFCAMGDRLPGASAKAVAEQLLSAAPEDLVSRPTRRRYPFAAVGFARVLLTEAGALRRFRAAIGVHWRKRIPAIADLDEPAARAELAAGLALFKIALARQCTVSLALVQPAFHQLRTLGGDELFALLAGQGSHEEGLLVSDLWACSRGRLELAEVVARHGYHGPAEGEISSLVWREDPKPLARLVERYAARDEAADPERATAARAAERARTIATLLAGLTPPARARARLVLRAADAYIPLRGVGKAAFLQALDLCRASARRFGNRLADRGALERPDDVWYLTADELLADPLPPEARELVTRRRALRAEYLTLDLPTSWVGTPRAVSAWASAPAQRVITGAGVSAGTVEGVVRVVHDPASAEVEEGDILVARTTDPSWASIMFLCSALVVDIGGMLSHAAVVARELGIPCVVNTRVGTSVLRTGDRCRVDGRTGVVELLS